MTWLVCYSVWPVDAFSHAVHDHAKKKQTGFLGEVQGMTGLQIYLFLSLHCGLTSSRLTVEKGT